jgi:peptide/nickel transport system permease protein
LIDTAARRLIIAVITIFCVMTFVFVASRATGDPVTLMLPLDATPAQRHDLSVQLGTDKSVFRQYLIYLGDAFHGNLGRSHRWQQPALSMVIARFPYTALLAGVAFLLAIAVSVPLGVLAATRRGSAIDAGVGLLTTAGQAVPNFVLALLLVWLFAVKLHWLPVAGSGGWRYLILPAVTLAAFPIAAQTRIIRSAVIDVLHQDYVRTAQAKGLRPLTVLSRHTLRGALVPIITILALQLSFFLGGAVVIETVFAWPGVGRLMVDAVSARDFPIVQSGTLVLCTLFITINALADVLYAAADPRYRHGN